MEKFEKLIIDTDIGDDIDDAFALALLAPYIKNNIVGVTTVFKNAFERAKIASYLLEMFGVETCVCAGESKPLKENISFLEFESPSQNPHISQYSQSMKDAKVNNTYGPDFIIECAEKYGENLTILAIGPSTNLAIAYQKSPESFKKIGKILMMGGNFLALRPEWNIKCDPEAFDIVLRSGVNIQMVGIDITKRATLLPEKVDELKQFTSKPLRLLNDMLNLYLSKYSYKRLSCMHDPLTASCLLEDFISFKEEKITVSLDKEKRGRIIPANDGYNVQVAFKADYEAFNKFLFQSLKKLNNQCNEKEALL